MQSTFRRFRNRVYTALLCGGLSVTTCMGAAQTHSAEIGLGEAMRLTISQSPVLVQTQARMAQAAARVQQSRSANGPNISLPASVSHQEYGESSTIGTLSQQSSVTYYRLGLSASWTLFDGFARRNRNLSAEEAETQSRAAYDDSVRLLMGNVAAAFHTAQLADANLRIAAADETFNRRSLKEAQARFDLGAGSRSESLNFEARANAAASEVLRQRERRTTAQTALAEVMGQATAALPLGVVPVTEGDGLSLPLSGTNVTDLIRAAMTFRPDVRAAKLGIRRSVADVAVAKGERWPHVDLGGSLDGERQDDASFDGEDFGNTVALSMRYAFSDGGQRRGRISEAQAVVDEREAVLQALSIRVASEVRQALASVAGTGARLALQERNAATVSENRDLTEREYRAGQTSLVRLNEAQRDLTSAQAQLALARVALRQARVRLLVATGEILSVLTKRE
jgi:outer membrane protein